MAREPSERTLNAYFAAIKALDADAFVGCFAEDAESEDPVGAPAHRGHAGIRAFFNGLAGAFTQAALEPEHTYFAGESAAVKWTGRGVAKKNGRNVTFEGIDVFDFDADGKIRRLRAYWDPTNLMRELRA